LHMRDKPQTCIELNTNSQTTILSLLQSLSAQQSRLVSAKPQALTVTPQPIESWWVLDNKQTPTSGTSPNPSEEEDDFVIIDFQEDLQKREEDEALRKMINSPTISFSFSANR